MSSSQIKNSASKSGPIKSSQTIADIAGTGISRIKKSVSTMLVCTSVIIGVQAAATPSSLEAQRPVRYGVLAGMSAPTGDLTDFTDAGYNIGIFAESRFPILPLAIRLEAALNEFRYDRSQVVGAGGSARSIGVTANGIVDLPAATLLKFYVIGGIGGYATKNVRETASGAFESYSEFKPGFNIGGGIRLPVGPIAGMLEVRYHSVAGGEGFSFVPISLGIRF